MPDGINTAMEAKQLTALDETPEDVTAIPGAEQLPPRHHAVLKRGHGSQSTWTL